MIPPWRLNQGLLFQETLVPRHGSVLVLMELQALVSEEDASIPGSSTGISYPSLVPRVSMRSACWRSVIPCDVPWLTVLRLHDEPP